ncbi:hypothetical protein FRC10_003400 [Ceratobasidium sp. 414]|nr:hypothetical protein FRC10_003400 [Ceratobasidium sp. 414]
MSHNLTLTKVCKLLKLFIDHSAKLRYIVEAHARGLEPLQNNDPAQHLISQLLARERSWTMFGSTPGVHAILDPPLENDDDGESPRVAERIMYDSGRVLVCCGSRLATRTLGPAQSDVREYMVPGLRDVVGNSIVASGDWIAFSTPSFTFLNLDEIALVRTNGSAGSAQIDVYAIGPSCAFIRSSLALPDAHPTKWYSKAGIYAGGMTASSGCEPLQYDRGVVAISLKLRVRAPHDPTTILTNRKLSVIVVIDKKAIAYASTAFLPGSSPIPWPKWSSNRFRVLSNIRLASSWHSSPVWGHRIITLGPEPDKLALFDFCAVGAKAASVVWKAPNAKGSTSNFSGGGGGRINGGVSVRAALAQRARTLVRTNSLGVGADWFEGMGVGVGGVAEQMPYVVSVRRGISGVESAVVDGERVIILVSQRSLVRVNPG